LQIQTRRKICSPFGKHAGRAKYQIHYSAVIKQTYKGRVRWHHSWLAVMGLAPLDLSMLLTTNMSPGVLHRQWSCKTWHATVSIDDFPQTLHIRWYFIPAITFSATDSMPLDFPQKSGLSNCLTDYTGTNLYNQLTPEHTLLTLTVACLWLVSKDFTIYTVLVAALCSLL